MTSAALLLHAATRLDEFTTRGHQFRQGESDDYWRGADEALVWVLATLRGRADELAEWSARLERLRLLATRASSGQWDAERGDTETTLTADGRRLGKVNARAADYLVAAQPSVVLAILDALTDADAPAPDTTALVEAARRAPRGSWQHTGCFLRDLNGADIGWLHHSFDVDYAVAAAPKLLLRLARSLELLRA